MQASDSHPWPSLSHQKRHVLSPNDGGNLSTAGGTDLQSVAQEMTY